MGKWWGAWACSAPFGGFASNVRSTLQASRVRVSSFSGLPRLSKNVG